MFAIWNHPQAGQVSQFALLNLQHRGQQGAGITVFDQEKGTWLTHKGPGLVNEVFEHKETLDRLAGNCALGSVHYSSQKQLQDQTDINPIRFSFLDESFAIAFSGHIVNAKSLRQELENQGSIFYSNSDGEVFAHLIRHSKEESMADKIKEACQAVKGGYSVSLLTEEGIYAFVDPAGLRPLVVGQLNQGTPSYLVTSESCALKGLGADQVYELGPGQGVFIDDSGYQVFNHVDHPGPNKVEAMEYIYFARPDSTIAGVNVYLARKNMGRYLAKENEGTQGDLVMGVPNSSLIAASGYAGEKGISYDLGLVKNQYVGRTFIEPSQELRELGVKNKLSVISQAVEDKDIILIDDSIVRGTTSKRIVKLLKEAGAHKVHLRISSPPILFPNYYGIDMSTSKELIAQDRTIQEMTDYIGCDSLAFLSIPALKQSVQDYNPEIDLSLSIFNGDYHEGLGDHQDYLEKHLSSKQMAQLQEGGSHV